MSKVAAEELFKFGREIYNALGYSPTAYIIKLRDALKVNDMNAFWYVAIDLAIKANVPVNEYLSPHKKVDNETYHSFIFGLQGGAPKQKER